MPESAGGASSGWRASRRRSGGGPRISAARWRSPASRATRGNRRGSLPRGPCATRSSGCSVRPASSGRATCRGRRRRAGRRWTACAVWGSVWTASARPAGAVRSICSSRRSNSPTRSARWRPPPVAAAAGVRTARPAGSSPSGRTTWRAGSIRSRSGSSSRSPPRPPPSGRRWKRLHASCGRPRWRGGCARSRLRCARRTAPAPRNARRSSPSCRRGWPRRCSAWRRSSPARASRTRTRGAWRKSWPSPSGCGIGSRASRSSSRKDRPGRGPARSRRDQEAGAGGGLGELADLLEQLGEGRPDLARDLERWARDWRSGAAPGTEAYKQDLSAWPALYGELRYVLEALEASRSRALAADEAADRLQAGAGAAAPESYRRLIDRYYRSLAARPTPR